VALIPLALRGVRFRAMGASAILRRNVWIYGVGGIIAPVAVVVEVFVAGHFAGNVVGGVGVVFAIVALSSFICVKNSRHEGSREAGSRR